MAGTGGGGEVQALQGGVRGGGVGVWEEAGREGEARAGWSEDRGPAPRSSRRLLRPQGGLYEGEWSGGVMDGVGVRTLSSGEVKAGRWRTGVLVEPLELWQCAAAVAGAADAALAARRYGDGRGRRALARLTLPHAPFPFPPAPDVRAAPCVRHRRVKVGGGRPQDALQLLAQAPVLWAVALGLALNVARVPLPASLDAVTAALAPANAPLLLLAFGVTMERWERPPAHMVGGRAGEGWGAVRGAVGRPAQAHKHPPARLCRRSRTWLRCWRGGCWSRSACAPACSRCCWARRARRAAWRARRRWPWQWHCWRCCRQFLPR